MIPPKIQGRQHWRFLFVLILALALVVCTGKRIYKKDKTPEQRMQEKTYVDFNDKSLPENKNMDLSVEPEDAAKQVIDRMTVNLKARLAKMFTKAKTPECRALIGEHMGHYINAIGIEETPPFGDFYLENECPEELWDFDDLPEGVHMGIIQNHTYQPEEGYYVKPEELQLCYALLTHDNPQSTIRLIEALYEPGNIFVVHVDGKESSEDTYQALVKYAATHDHVHVLPHPYRCRINWGGFSMVNATLQILHYAFAVHDWEGKHNALQFNKLVHLASTSYPLQSNTAIRNKIAEYPLDANLLHVIMKPTNPGGPAWQYFVECDDAVHRITRLDPMSTNWGGFELYTSSQWFIISRTFAKYIAEAKPKTFVHEYLDYIQHVVVADETFFGTVMRNTPFCTTHHNWNFLHLQFDRWESDLEQQHRDERKCMMPKPDHCGRSPTTMTVDYIDVLELSGDLFARKFDDSVDSEIKDILDARRAQQELELTGKAEPVEHFDMRFEGHGVLIVAKETTTDPIPLCMGLGGKGNLVRLLPCFFKEVIPSLADDWETGAVIEQETLMGNRWELGPCSTDGKLKRLASAEMEMTPGDYSPTGPKCMLKQGEGPRIGRCVDVDNGNHDEPGGPLHVYPCTNRWHQYVSFGNGTLAPPGSLFATVPRHLVAGLALKDIEQVDHMCIGVEAPDKDEEEDEEDEEFESYEASLEKEKKGASKKEVKPGDFRPLSKFKGSPLVTTDCSDPDAIIEWLFVPFIVEEGGETEKGDKATNEQEL